MNKPILVISDRKTIRDSLKKVLSLDGTNVDSCNSEEAIEYLSKKEYNCVFAAEEEVSMKLRHYLKHDDSDLEICDIVDITCLGEILSKSGSSIIGGYENGKT